MAGWFGWHWGSLITGNGQGNLLNGSNRSDLILGYSGDDTIDAGRGHDTVFGGWGDDSISGGRGHDWLFGGSGDDTIDGGKGHDRIFGGCGDDSIDGGRGHDKLFGGWGNDALNGGKGRDILFGGFGDDTLSGGAGSDYVNAGFGNDTAVYVLADNGWGRDFYDGGKGTDTLTLTLTQAEAADADVQADIDRFEDFLDDHANPWTNHGPVFYFNSFRLAVQDFENFELNILGGGNTAPVAVDDSATTHEDVAVNIDVLGNDSDADGDSLTVTAATAANGSVVIEADGSLTYTGNADFNGSDTISYTISDGNGGTDTAEVAVTVNAVKDGPVAVDDSATTDEDVAVNIDVLGNDSDVDGDNLTVTVTTAANGSVVIEADGSLTYTGNADFNGSDTISYAISDGNGGTDTAEVAVTVNAVNDGPVAVDDSATTDEDVAVSIDVLSNDSDVDGDSLTVAAATAANGSVVIESDGSLTYTGNVDFNGNDTISYTISDGNGGTDTASVAVTVNAVNDGPVALDDSATTDEDVAVNIDVLGNDSDVDGDSLTVTTATAANGSVVIESDGSLTYSGNADFNGSDTISYTISDGNGGTDTAEVAVTVNAVNDGPVAVDDSATTDEDVAVSIDVLSNDSDVDGDSLTVTTATAANGSVVIETDGSLTYTGNADFNGSDTISYTISDGNGGTDTAQVAVTVNAVNDGPVALDDSATTDEDVAVNIDVLGNDSDVDGDSLTVTTATAANGSVVIESDGSLTYTGNADFNGNDTISYTISDGNGGTDTAQVAVTVNAVSQPIANADSNQVFASEANLLQDPTPEPAPATGNLIEGGAHLNANLTPVRDGAEFVVNTDTVGSENGVRLSSLEGGGFVAVWKNAPDNGFFTSEISAQVYGADGLPVGTEFQVNSTSNGEQFSPHVAGLADGGFVVVWRDVSGGLSETNPHLGQRYDSNGNPLGSEFVISNGPSNTFNPTIEVIGLDNGGFMVAWDEQLTLADNSPDIFGQSYDADGSVAGPVFQINSFATGLQSFPRLTKLDNGDIVAIWRSSEQDGDSLGVFGQRLDPAGNPVGGEFQINTQTDGLQFLSDVSSLADGGFIVTWRDVEHPDGDGIYAQRYDINGMSVGGEERISPESLASVQQSAVVGLPDGGYLITWRSDNGDDGSSSAVLARRFDADGNAVGTDFIVPTTTESGQSIGDAVLLADGRVVVAWSSNGGTLDGNLTGIGAQILSLPQPEDGTADVADVSVDGNDLDIQTIQSDNVPGNVATAPSAGVLQIAGALGVLTVDQETGDYSYDLDDVAGRSLARGQTLDDIFIYTLLDANGQTAQTTLTVTVHGGNDAPTASDFSLSTDEATIISGNVLADNGAGVPFDPDGDAFAFFGPFGQDLSPGSIIFASENGAIVTLNDDGSFDYDPTNFAGLSDGETLLDTFTILFRDENLGETQQVVSVEVTGFTSVIDGTAGNDTLFGTVGDNLINAGGGDDVVRGANNSDTIFGDTGNDTLRGSGGDDEIFGGAGNDIIDGERGNDLLTGGDSADVFIIDDGFASQSDGNDTILDFTSGEDRVSLDNDFGFNDFSEILAASVDVGADMVINLPDTGGGLTTLTLLGVNTDDLIAADFFF